MHKVVFVEKNHEQIQVFAKSFHYKNIELYIDSGLEDEEVIIKHYKILSKSLRDALYNCITIHCREDVVGKKVLLHNTFQTSLSYLNIRIFVTYSEDTHEQIRYLESIEFFRK